jgi:hypothetical protein
MLGLCPIAMGKSRERSCSRCRILDVGGNKLRHYVGKARQARKAIKYIKPGDMIAFLVFPAFLALNAMRFPPGAMRRRGHLTLAGLNEGQPKRFSHPLVEDRLSGLPPRTFGSLQGIQLHNLLGSGLHVGGEITGAVFPLDLWFWAGLAINALR